MWKANKVPDEDLAPSTSGHRRPFEYQRVPHLGLSLLRILEARTNDKASACNAGDPGSIPGSGRSPGEGNDNPLQYSFLENPTNARAWYNILLFVNHNCGSKDVCFLMTPYPKRNTVPDTQKTLDITTC
ncbi:hypothetical protein MG293_000893 [Ovis ammon polii]|uniref:Uncharacterized protein n=1 Tax=Ovis ammon polii TaxID=230172 RepID=A0AAD4YHP7_OVIAM|nr:hypothetical protein MG293_000893 [Ovis ammon polii]